MTKGEFDRTIRAIVHAIRYPSKHKNFLNAAKSWQYPPRAPKHIEQLQSMTLVELWEFSQQLEELSE